MNTKIKVDLGDIQKTLLMPLWAMVVETGKDKPLVTDHKAVEIAEKIDYDFAAMATGLDGISQIAWVARSKRFDMVTRDFINKKENPVVVNVGCGLDTMCYRLNDPKVMWLDLDLPDVIGLRKELFTESANHKYIAGSFMETSWFEHISGRNVLFLFKGLLVYFSEEEVRNFLVSLAGAFPGAELFADVTSPKGVEVANGVIVNSGIKTDAIFKWGITDKDVFNRWDDRLMVVATYYTYRISGLHLSLKDRITGFISDFLKIQYMIHLSVAG